MTYCDQVAKGIIIPVVDEVGCEVHRAAGKSIDNGSLREGCGEVGIKPNV